MSQYLGIDWLAVGLTFPAIHLLSQHSRTGFLLMMAGNVCWTTIGIWAGSLAMTLANLAFLAMNLHGFRSWSRKRDFGDSHFQTQPPAADEALADPRPEHLPQAWPRRA
jgi:hypothetical protein